MNSNLANLGRLKLLTYTLAALLGTDVGNAVDAVVLPLVADTTLFELDPSYNFGSQRDLPAGTLGPMGKRLRSRLLLRADVASALPNGATITAARLRTDVTMVPVGRVNSTFSMHRVLVSWEEGDKRDVDNPGGAEATEGEATWLHRMHPDVPWTVPGGAFGTDYSDKASASRPISAAGTYTFPFNAEGLADLCDMVADPASNHGWVLVTESEEDAKTARRFAAREHRTAPPMLEIEYSVAKLDVPQVDVSINEEQIVLRFDTSPGQTYCVQSTADLDAPNWIVEELIGPQAGGEAVFRNNLNESRRFFRIMVDTNPR